MGIVSLPVISTRFELLTDVFYSTRAQLCVRMKAPEAVEKECKERMIEASGKWVEEREKVGEVEAPDYDGPVIHVGGEAAD